MIRRLLPRRLGHAEEAELTDHLGELRSRLVVCLATFVPAFALAFAVHGRLVELLSRPLPDGQRLVTLGVTEPFTTSIKVSVAAALALVLPMVLWQTWAFLAPAFDPGLQRSLAVLLASSAGLFVAGVAFAYVVVLPRALAFLVGFDAGLYDTQVRAASYYGFVSMLLLAAGLAFQLPVVVLGLVRTGVTSARSLRRNRRVAYAALVAFAVILPTVDPVSLALEVAPLLVLYELSVVLAAAFERRWSSQPAAT